MRAVGRVLYPLRRRRQPVPRQAVRAGAEGTSTEPTSDAGPAGVDELLTAGEAGDDLRTGERFVRRLIAERHIAYVNLGEYVRAQRSALDTFLESGRVSHVSHARWLSCPGRSSTRLSGGWPSSAVHPAMCLPGSTIDADMTNR